MSKKKKSQNPVNSQKAEDLKDKIDSPSETENKADDAPGADETVAGEEGSNPDQETAQGEGSENTGESTEEGGESAQGEDANQETEYQRPQRTAGDEYDLAEKAFVESSLVPFFVENHGMTEFNPDALPKNADGVIVYQLLNADGEQVAAGTLEELAAKAKEEGYDPAANQLIAEQIIEVQDHFKAADVQIEQESDETVAILHLLDAEGKEIVSGPLHELFEKAKAEKAARAAPAPRPKAKGKIEGDMKIRWIPFDRRKVLRVIQPFEHGGVQYEAGMIFDWAVLGMKPYHVNRLYNRKVVRHIVEDSRVSYPFRPERKASGKPKAKEAPQGGDQGQNAPTGGENGQNGSPDDNQNQGTAPNGNQPAKFSKKGAHRNK